MENELRKVRAENLDLKKKLRYYEDIEKQNKYIKEYFGFQQDEIENLKARKFWIWNNSSFLGPVSTGHLFEGDD